MVDNPAKNILKYKRTLKEKARELRNNPTPAENNFGYFLRTMPFYQEIVFNRQKPLGNYIVDFYCRQYKLIIEIDGDSHYSVSGLKHDKTRTEYLESLGFRVLRYTNPDILNNIEGVMSHLMSVLNEQGYKE